VRKYAGGPAQYAVLACMPCHPNGADTAEVVGPRRQSGGALSVSAPRGIRVLGDGRDIDRTRLTTVRSPTAQIATTTNVIPALDAGRIIN